MLNSIMLIMNWLWHFIDRVKILIAFLWLNLIKLKYPMWFIRMLDGKTIDIALSRDNKTQLAYKSRTRNFRDQFVDSLFDPRLVSQHIPFRFVPNNFPYFVENGINHFIFWIRPDYECNHDPEFIRSCISLYVISRFRQPLEFCFFRNSIENKSILEIEHYHVFIKQYPSMWVIDVPSV